jgi:hypothetical protein
MTSKSRRLISAGALLLAIATACHPHLPVAAPGRVDEPNPDSVETVVFLIGDAGDELPGESPVIARLQREVEAWSGGLGRDSAVSVLFLGDNVYPAGIREPTDPEYALDTLRLRGQLDVVAGPNARLRQTTAYFVAGNHDWGNMIGAAGLRRLQNQQTRINAARNTGLQVRLLPEAGQAGPAVVDLGRHARMVFLDTHWWLQERTPAPKAAVFQGVERALTTAGNRRVIIAAHHPFVSGGAHGGPMPIWEGLGIIWLLRQTGSLVQDLNSVVYKELLTGLKGVFARTRQPDIFAAGHDHSLQVIEDQAPDEPHWSIVSGAGSKLTQVTYMGGTKWAGEDPGFIRLAFMTDGRVLLHVLTTADANLSCSTPGTDVDKCMAAGDSAFKAVYALPLFDATPAASATPATRP